MLIEKYNELYQKVKALTDSIGEAESRLSGTDARRDTEIPARIANLEEQLKKIDEYALKIESFRQIAENHLESRNLLTIEAQPGYRVNLNRLRNWAMMIDPMSTNDPYAQRVYLTAKCDEHFLAKKKQEFTERIESLKSDGLSSDKAETEKEKSRIARARAQLTELAGSLEVAEFAKLVDDATKEYRFEALPETYASPGTAAASVALGAYAVSLGFPAENHQQLRQVFGTNSDESGEWILLPVEMPANREFAISVTCASSRVKRLDRGLQNLVMNTISKNPAGEHKVYVLDAVRYSSAALGSLKQLEDTFAIERLPRNPEQTSALLERIVSSFADMDDILELHDSVIEYNEQAEPAKRLQRSTLIVFGMPNAFEGQDREYMQRILTNYERYGISFICVSFSAFNKKEEPDKGLPEYAAQNATYINMKPRETTINLGMGAQYGFSWYAFSNELPESYAESLRQVKIGRAAVGSEYTKRYDISAIPPYTREYKKLELPYGVDARDNAHSMSFENENFAAYLVGASGSGKSTLLHTLIAGIIRNFHPDNVELWLADFKQLEFKKYMKHCPPHIKYILLDESVELVYDLVDRINDKMIERQRIFARLGKERLNQIDPRSLDEPMPLIFIILDEFSVMSQAVSESSVYKLRLQNVLAKGRALGIRFLFASQTFTKGIAGLTPTAKDQIQQRISMKGTREEISETLELSANLKTDQVRNWMDALPPFYALVKHRTGADSPPEVIRVNVMYFPDYGPRDDMIDRLNASMAPVERYNPNDVGTYVNKYPVTVDGNTYDAFAADGFKEFIQASEDAGEAHSSEGAFVTFGAPRLMERMKVASLTQETRENILLLGRNAEQPCTAAIITSAMKSFLIQGHKVKVWAYGKDRLYKAYRGTVWNAPEFGGVLFFEGIDSVCDEIRALRGKIAEKEASNELIVLIGMDRICSDFDFIDSQAPAEGSAEKAQAQVDSMREKEAIKSGAVASNEYDKAYDAWSKKQFSAWSKAKKEAAAAGKSKDKARQAGEKASLEFSAKFPPPRKEDFADSAAGDRPEQEQAGADAAATAEKGATAGAYDAMEDFQYVVKQGSRLGYHFMLYLSSYADLKATALKLDMFRHRMAFQIPVDDSRELFGNRNASALPERICQYYDTLEGYSFRPYMHRGITWDGWEVGEDGLAINPFEPKE